MSRKAACSGRPYLPYISPIPYLHLPISQEHKSQSSLLWFGLGLNIFFGNVVAITQQALWVRVRVRVRVSYLTYISLYLRIG